MKIQTLEISGYFSALRAMRLPYKSQDKSDTDIESLVYPVQHSKNFLYGKYEITVGDKDLKLLSNLVKTGDEHAKVIRGIVVSVEIDAPRYWWQEMDTYRIGHERLSSESTMHCEAKNLVGEELQKIKSEIKEGHVQKRIDQFSYQTIRRIYFQRKTHRLPEWKKFCQWIEELPLANNLITI